MKKLFLALALLTGMISYSQNLTLKWSNDQIYKANLNGFFKSFIDENDKYIYVRFGTHSGSFKTKESKLKIVAFDKTTMKEVAGAAILGFKENKSTKEAYKGLDYYKTLVSNDAVYVLWKRELKNSEEIYIQSFDAKLHVTQKLKKIYVLTAGSDKKSTKPAAFLLFNKKFGKLVVGGERSVKEGEKVKMEYKLLDEKFEVIATNQVELPVIAADNGGFFSKRRGGLSSSYTLGDDGKLHLSTSIAYTKEQREKMKKLGEKVVYSQTLYSFINLETGKMKTIPFAFEDKRILEVRRDEDKANTKFYGFFSDTKKDPLGNSTHGVFYCTLNANYEFENINFSYFTAQQLAKLFANDVEDKNENQKKGTCGGCFGGKSKGKNNAGEMEKLADDYVIEESYTDKDGSLYLFCSRMNNWSRTVCTTSQNGGTTCHTYYYCTKSNVTTFKITKDGKLDWAENVDRLITYSNWDVYDISVIQSDKGFYAIYGNAYEKKAGSNSTKKNSGRKRVKDADGENPFYYAFFDKATGASKVNVYKVNRPDTKKKFRKKVDPTDVVVFDNKFYVNNDRFTLRPGPTAIACTAVTFTAGCGYFFLPLFSQQLYKGVGNIGVIEPVE